MGIINNNTIYKPSHLWDTTQNKMNELENKILGDLQERNATLQQCLEDISNIESLDKAKRMADECLGALAVVETITPKTPIWIGVEIPTSWGYYNICIGVNQEDGHEISYCNETDIQFGKEQSYDCWNYDGKIVVEYGTDSRVFNDNHELINNKPKSLK